jgi:hypothetical protein
VEKRTGSGIRADRSAFAFSKSFLKTKIGLPGWGDTFLVHETVIDGGKLVGQVDHEKIF